MLARTETSAGKVVYRKTEKQVTTGYVTAKQRDEAALRKQQRAAEEQAPVAGVREGMTPRAIGPVARGTIGKAVTKLTEARGEKTRVAAITPEEMQAANAEAEKLKQASPKERAEQVKEAEKIAAELAGIDTDKRGWRAKWLKKGGELDTVLRETDETKYDAPSATPLKMGVINALNAGDTGKVLSMLAQGSSNKFVQKGAVLLPTTTPRPLLRALIQMRCQKKTSCTSLFMQLL